MSEFSKGDLVYGICPYTGIEKLKIEDIRYDESAKINYYYVSHLCTVDRKGMDIDNTHGNSGIKTEDIFETYTEAFNERDKRTDNRIQSYLDRINSTNDLVKLPLLYNFGCEEYTYYEAIEAYKLKAKELGFEV